MAVVDGQFAWQYLEGDLKKLQRKDASQARVVLIPGASDRI